MATHATYGLVVAAVILSIVLQVSAASAGQKPTIRISPYPLDPAGKIINGTLASGNDTMHQVSIRNKYRDGIFFGTGHLCGGSLITPNVVLSAAHCFVDYTDPDKTNSSFLDASEFIVVMGNLDRYNQTDTLSFTLLNVTMMRQTFNLSTYDQDIALLFLNGSVPTNSTHIRPIELNRQPVVNGTICQVTGWGQTEEGYITDKLRTVNVPAIPRPICVNESDYGEMIHAGMMCAGYMEEGEKDACSGDSGGPLVCKGLQAGIVSWGSGCAVPYRPGVYTDLAYFQEWIDQKLNRNGSRHLEATLFGVIMALLVALRRWLCC